VTSFSQVFSQGIDLGEPERSRLWLEDIRLFEEGFLNVSKTMNADSVEVCKLILNDLKSNIQGLTDANVITTLARCVSKANNGHTNIHLAWMDKIGVRFFWFSDGLYIVKAAPEFESLLGHRVIEINGKSVEEVQKHVEPFLSGNNNWKRYLGTNLLASPEFLQGIGISDADSISLKVSGDGIESTVSFGIVDPGFDDDLYDPFKNLYPVKKSGASWSHVLDASDGLPLYLGKLSEGSFYAFDDEHKLAYLNINSNPVTKANTRIKGIIKSFQASLKKKKDYAVVLDLRFFTGGNYLSYLKLAKKTPKIIGANGKMYLLTSNMTYSAGVITSARIKHFAGTRLTIVGEHVGDNLKFRSENKWLQLPNSKLYVRDAKFEHDFENNNFERGKSFWLNRYCGVAAKDLKVDHKVSLDFASYLNGQDPVLEWVISDLVK